MEPSDLFNYFNGNSSDAEKKAVENWRNASDNHKQQFKKWQKIWTALAPQNSAPPTDTNLAWEKVESHLKPKRKVFYLWSRVAAAAVVVVGLVFLIQYFGVTPVEMMMASTVDQEIKEITLPDGSTVWLNEGTSLEYPKTFQSDQRKVKLRGEAFFSVRPDQNAPFVIEAKQTAIRVLGTSFLFSAYPDSLKTQVQVESGKVAFYALNTSASNYIELEKNQQARYDKQIARIDTVPDQVANALAWKDHSFTFQETNMKEVKTTIEKAYKVKLVFQNPAIQSCAITGKFENISLEELFELLATILDLKIQSTTEKTYSIDGPGCE